MNDSEKIIFEVLCLSGGIWILFYLFSNFSIQRFIVRRYVQETALSDTIFFNRHAVFIKGLPDFLSAGFYAAHLLTFVWGWKVVQYLKQRRSQIPYFDDINGPQCVTDHFSKQEIARVKWLFFCGIVFFFHMIAIVVVQVNI